MDFRLYSAGVRDSSRWHRPFVEESAEQCSTHRVCAPLPRTAHNDGGFLIPSSFENSIISRGDGG